MSRIISDLPSVPVTLRVAGVRLRRYPSDYFPVRVEFAAYRCDDGVRISFKKNNLGDEFTIHPIHVALSQRECRKSGHDGRRSDADIVANLTYYYNQEVFGQMNELQPYFRDDDPCNWFLNINAYRGAARLAIDDYRSVVHWRNLYRIHSIEWKYAKELTTRVKEERAARREFEAVCARHTNVYGHLPDRMM